MPLLTDLLAKGYFPRELPPPFNTRSFAQYVENRWAELPLVDDWHRGLRTHCCRHDVARTRGLRRTLSIPNPFAQMLLCIEIAVGYPAIVQHVLAPPRPLLSASRPVYWQHQPRALVTRYSLRELPRLRLRSRVGMRYILRADVASFYSSIYTHSIPWALHTKPVAKANRGPRLLGNRLDRLVRNAQDGQTLGIPIGPDTSLLVAECILRPVDDELRRALGDVSGFRYIDDYELGFRSLGEAENARAAIERTLADFELLANATKTAISEVPISISRPWVEELRDARGGTGRIRCNARAIGRFADIALRAASDHPSDSVLKFAVATLRGVTPANPEAWQMLQSFLLNAIAADTGTLPYVIDIVDRLQVGNLRVNPRRWEVAVDAVLAHHAPLRHGDEVSWALWATLVLGLRLAATPLTLGSIGQMENDIVALLSLQYNAQHPGAIPIAVWSQWMTRDELDGPHWLVAY
jgi:hypothetical protein